MPWDCERKLAVQASEQRSSEETSKGERESGHSPKRLGDKNRRNSECTHLADPSEEGAVHRTAQLQPGGSQKQDAVSCVQLQTYRNSEEVSDCFKRLTFRMN